MATKTIKVNYLARVEGEGALHVTTKNGQVQDVALNIFEPPRYFEALLRGRQYTEAPDITARICGICPVAYQMSAVHAMEYACGVTVGGPLRDLRRLLYTGEWIESHGLHIYLLHAPDFLGYPDAIHLAKDFPDAVKRGLEMKKIGNELVAAVGGREIHPINVKVGGFYRVPSRSELARLRPRLEWARDAAYETVKWAATLPFPDIEFGYDFVALRHPSEYGLNEGRIVSSSGVDIPVELYETVFEEQHEKRSTALHSVMIGKGSYAVGPLARYNLNFDRLSPAVQAAAREVDLVPPMTNPFKSIVVRSLETMWACDEALRIVEGYEEPDAPAVDVPPRAGMGYACTEAPRGILYHRYEIAEDGTILHAKITPPTAQNQKTIESDLRGVVTDLIDLPKPELTLRCEQAIRNYDPCISCSTHFLRLEFEEA